MLKTDKEMVTHYGHSIYNSRLPEDWRTQPTHRIIVVTSRKNLSLPIQSHSIVFSNFNHPWKLDPKTFKGWMQVIVAHNLKNNKESRNLTNTYYNLDSEKGQRFRVVADGRK